MGTDAPLFRVLLAEDDPVSREFLIEALQACGCEASACADGDAALARAQAQAFDLLLLDQHLPGRHGDAVLAALRADPRAASRASPALATSAEPAAHAPQLLRAGFAEVLPKPITLAELLAALRRHGLVTATALDDAEALRACGTPATAARLRRLFADEELPKLAAELAGNPDPQALRPALHRLVAACGFCGAPLLGQACATLQQALANAAGEVAVAQALAGFRQALATTRAALATALQEAG